MRFVGFLLSLISAIHYGANAGVVKNPSPLIASPPQLSSEVVSSTDNSIPSDEIEVEKRQSGSGSFWLYPCGNCKCDAGYSYTNFAGATPCLNVGSQTAIGMTWANGHSTSCSLYFEPYCGGDEQSAGVYSSQSWGCTAGDKPIMSVKCYWNAS